MGATGWSSRRRRGRRAARFVAVLAAGVAVAAACAPTPAPARTAVDPACAWGAAAIGSQLGPASPTNVVFPDTSANYWITPLTLAPTTTVTIEGGAIAARYWSVQTYSPLDLFGSTIDGRRDDQVATASDGSWSLTVTAAGAPDGSALRGVLAPGDAGPSWVMFRTYLSEDPAAPAGADELPTVTIRDTWGERVLAPCARPVADPPGDSAATRTEGSAPSWLPAPAIRFRRTVPAVTPFPNGDAAYIAAIAARRAGEVVVIRGLAPSVPDGPAGSPDPDLRYWSWCQFGLPSTATVACTPDLATPLDDDGRYTIVISDPRDRPSNATAADGVAWLPWGRQVLGAFALRNLAPAPGFTSAVQAVTPNAFADSAAMGDHLPVAAFCATERFEREGPLACSDPGLP